MEQRQEHPLDGEEIAIVVSLTHGPTLTQSVGTAESHEGTPFEHSLGAAARQALDEMLAQLEVIGG